MAGTRNHVSHLPSKTYMYYIIITLVPIDQCSAAVSFFTFNSTNMSACSGVQKQYVYILTRNVLELTESLDITSYYDPHGDPPTF